MSLISAMSRPKTDLMP